MIFCEESKGNPRNSIGNKEEIKKEPIIKEEKPKFGSEKLTDLEVKFKKFKEQMNDEKTKEKKREKTPEKKKEKPLEKLKKKAKKTTKPSILVSSSSG